MEIFILFHLSDGAQQESWIWFLLETNSELTGHWQL